MFDGEEEEVFRGGGVREKGDAVTSSKVCTVHVLRYGICAMYIPVRYFLNQNRPVSAMRQTRQIQNTRRSKITDFLYQRFVFYFDGFSRFSLRKPPPRLPRPHLE